MNHDLVGELAALFLLMSLVVGLIGGLGENDQYLKLIAPLLLVLFVLCTAFIAVCAALS